MLRFGIVTDIDASAGKARVSFQEDDIVSDWLPICFPKAMDDSFSWMPDVNEHVACLMDEFDEKGVIVGAIYSQNVKPNGGNKDKFRARFKDGTVIEYDRAAHKLTADVKGQVEILATGNVKVDTDANLTAECVNGTVKATTLIKLDAPNVQVTGILTCGQLATSTGPGFSGTGGAQITGDMNIVDGDVTVTGGDVVADSKSLKTHVHTGVSAGVALSGPPQ